MLVVRQKSYKDSALPSQDVKQEIFAIMKNKVSLAPVRLAVWGAAQCEIQHPHSLG